MFKYIFYCNYIFISTFLSKFDWYKMNAFILWSAWIFIQEIHSLFSTTTFLSLSDVSFFSLGSTEAPLDVIPFWMWFRVAKNKGWLIDGLINWLIEPSHSEESLCHPFLFSLSLFIFFLPAFESLNDETSQKFSLFRRIVFLDWGYKKKKLLIADLSQLLPG